MAKPKLFSPGVSNLSFAITPSDTTGYAQTARRVYVGGAGVVALVNLDDSVTNFTVPAGGYIDCASKRVNSTNTTATLLVGLQ